MKKCLFLDRVFLVLPIECADLPFPKGGDDAVSFTVRPWFESVEDLQAKAFAADTPEQRQQLFLDGKQLQDDGRVLAQHGIVAETKIQLVSA